MTVKHLNITLRHLRTFVVVAQHGSFNLAAKELHRTQPAITLAIKQLEEFIGLKLLERTTRRVMPTVEGEHFMPVAERLIRDFDIAIRDLSATAERRSGHVSMAVLPSVATQLLPGVLQEFATQYPGISIHLSDDNSKGVQRRIIRNEVDLGIASLSKSTHELEFTPLLQDNFELICHEDHELARGRGPIGWRALKGHNFLDSGIRQTLQMKRYIGVPKFEFSTTTTLYAMLKANIGITALPALAVPRAEPDLVSRQLVDPVETRDIGLIKRKDWTLAPASDAMVEVLLAKIPELSKERGFNAVDTF